MKAELPTLAIRLQSRAAPPRNAWPPPGLAPTLPPIGATKRFKQDPLYVRVPLIRAGVGAIVGNLIVVPIVNVFYRALARRLGQAYWHNLVDDPDTRNAIWLTLIVAPVSVARSTSSSALRRPGPSRGFSSAAARCS